MTALAVETAAACLGIGACGYLIGRMHARAIFQARRPGYTVGPFVDPPEWNFPAAPPYDQQAHREQPNLTASLGHPLVPDMRGYIPDKRTSPATMTGYDDGGEFTRRVGDPFESSRADDVMLETTVAAMDAARNKSAS